jgi:hypothetical protein
MISVAFLPAAEGHFVAPTAIFYLPRLTHHAPLPSKEFSTEVRAIGTLISAGFSKRRSASVFHYLASDT